MSLFGRKPEPQKKPDSSSKSARPSPERDRPEEVASDASPAPADRNFGIHDVIRLMRSLPVDEHPELVVLVMKSTLESMHVSVEDIIEDSRQHESLLEAQACEVQDSIDELKRKLDAQQAQLAEVQGEMAEIRTAKERLLLTDGYSTAAPPVPAASASQGPPKSPARTPRPAPSQLTSAETAAAERGTSATPPPAPSSRYPSVPAAKPSATTAPRSVPPPRAAPSSTTPLPSPTRKSSPVASAKREGVASKSTPPPSDQPAVDRKPRAGKSDSRSNGGSDAETKGSPKPDVSDTKKKPSADRVASADAGNAEADTCDPTG